MDITGQTLDVIEKLSGQTAVSARLGCNRDRQNTVSALTVECEPAKLIVTPASLWRGQHSTGRARTAPLAF
jgi:hypothetical protein